MEAQAREAGARFELRDGWNVAIDYGDAAAERTAVETTGAWTDVSQLGKIELQAAPARLAQIIAGAGGARPSGSTARRAQPGMVVPADTRAGARDLRAIADGRAAPSP